MVEENVARQRVVTVDNVPVVVVSSDRNALVSTTYVRNTMASRPLFVGTVNLALGSSTT